MSRLVVFALGAVFGAAALALIAPRWRDAFDLDVVREPARTLIAGHDEPVETASVRAAGDASQHPDARDVAAADAAVAEAPVLPVEDAPSAPGTASVLPGAADPPPDEASLAAADAEVAAQPASAPPVAIPIPPAVVAPPVATPTSPAAESTVATAARQSTPPAAEQTIAPDPAKTAPPQAPAVAADQPVVDVPPAIPAGLLIPVEGATPESLIDTFTEARGGGSRPHDAIDIMAPAGTPVRAVDDGRVAKLFLSDAGGITIYQFDAGERYAYYYAHLERYAEGLEEGDTVKRGEVIGYVGYTGNANPAAPHLHFAIMALGPDKRWWQGTAINPYPILVGATKPEAAQVAAQ